MELSKLLIETAISIGVLADRTSKTFKGKGKGGDAKCLFACLWLC